MYITTTGLVLRETPYKESSRILTVLTASEGKLTVSARGAKRRGSRTAAGTQLLAFSEMTLFFSRGRWTLTESNCIELFSGLRGDIERLTLGSYFAELLEALSDADSPNPEILALGLNGLFALSEGKKEPSLVKAAFEMRLMCLSGFEPMLSCCSVCGKTVIQKARFDLIGGTIRCRDCKTDELGASEQLNEGALDALRHIASCDPKRLFSFKLGDEALRRLSNASERYVLTQLERSFQTLDYYKRIKT